MLARLTGEQRKSLMELLIYLAKSDGHVDIVDKQILNQYAHLNGVQDCAFRTDASLRELVAPFHSVASRIAVIAELLRLSHSHPFFADEEQSAIVDVAALLGIPMDLLAKVEEWVMERLEVESRASELIEEAKEVVRV